MSDSWQGVTSTGTGNWSVGGNWSSGSVPGSTTVVSIGPSVTAAGPWVLSVTDSEHAARVDMEPTAGGTLSIAGGGTLAVSGTVDLDVNGGKGAALVVGQGGTLNVAGGVIQNYAATTYEVNGGVVSVSGAGNYFDLGTGAVATVQAGGVVDTPELYVGLFGAANLTVTGASTINTGSLVVNAGTVDLDGNSMASVSGVASVGAFGKLVLGNATVAGTVVDNGAIALSSGADLAVIGGNLSGTGDLSIAVGDTLVVDGVATGFMGPVSMLGGTLDLSQATYGSGPPLDYSASTGTLTVGTQSLFVGTGLSISQFHVAKDSGTGTLLTEVACYAAGTRIATERGEAPVETLREGDRVRTAAGRSAPVRWVGRTTLDVHAQPHLAPVRIAAGAFAPGLPRRDLLVSGDHAIAVGGVLIPARRLLNDCTIRQEPALGTVTYVHVELDRHDLLLAEGLPAESYLDTGNRGQLDGTGRRLIVGDPEAAALRAFAERGCAKLVLRGPDLNAARAALRARAEACGWRLDTDPALTVEADHPGIEVAHDGHNGRRLLLPPGGCQLRLRSRSFIPALLDPATPDGRRLGVALAVERDGAPLMEGAFGPGWYAPDAGVTWRWTDGAATLALHGRPQRSVLTVRILATGARYWGREPAAALAA